MTGPRVYKAPGTLNAAWWEYCTKVLIDSTQRSIAKMAFFAGAAWASAKVRNIADENIAKITKELEKTP